MSLLFIASEVGSVRALEPVIALCQGQYPTHVIRCDFDENSTSHLSCTLKKSTDPEKVISQFLDEYKIKLVIFSANVKDALPLIAARMAARKNIPTLHILDYWNGYASRMCLDGGPRFRPTAYAVPDAYAADCAIKEGIDSNTLVITGQPALADVFSQYQAALSRAPIKLMAKLKLDSHQKTLMFVSEPVACDQGNNCQENPNYRGYTEKEVLHLLLQACLEFNDRVKYHSEMIQLCIMPHPRENIESLTQYWSSIGGEKIGRVIRGIRNRDLLAGVYGVVGMSSSLLYESWLIGKPVLSIQPGLLNNSLRLFENKDGITFTDSYSAAPHLIIQWLNQLPAKHQENPSASAIQARSNHKNAAINIMALIKQVIL